MEIGKVRTFLIKCVLFAYNGIIFVIMNFVLWRNHAWNEKEWTKVNPIWGRDTKFTDLR